MATGDEIEAGKNTGANHTTRLVGEQTDPPQTDFSGDEILEVVPLPDSSRAPGQFLDGIVGAGWTGPANISNLPTGRLFGKGTGVIGKGGVLEGIGVLGLGSDRRSGGTGVHGIGGPHQVTVEHPDSVPGAGVIGEGGRADAANPERLLHGAGVIGVAGGKGLDPLQNRKVPPHRMTGSVGVFGLGGTAETVHVPDGAGGTIVTGAAASGPGVVGHGGISEDGTGSPGPGVVGIAGDLLTFPGSTPPVLPWQGPADAVGVWGEGKSGEGVHGRSEDHRGGVFESAREAQIQLVPRQMDVPNETPFSPTAIDPSFSRRRPLRLPRRGKVGDLLTTVGANGACTLWLCVARRNNGTAQWAQVLLGPPHDGTA